MCLKSKINSKNLEKYIYALSFRGKSILILNLVTEDINIDMLGYMIIVETLLWKTKIKGKL